MSAGAPLLASLHSYVTRIAEAEVGPARRGLAARLFEASVIRNLATTDPVELDAEIARLGAIEGCAEAARRLRASVRQARPSGESAPRAARRGHPDVVQLLDYERSGRARASRGNAVEILLRDPRWRDRVHWCEHRELVVVDDEPWTDARIAEVALWLEGEYGAELRTPAVREALLLVARRHPVHPVRAYLDGLRWDGTGRLSAWLCDYLGAEESAVTCAAARLLLVSAVARVRDPGCRAETMVILVGPQGRGKSRAIETLAVRPQWHSADPIVVGAKDSEIERQGAWICEWGELDGLSRRDASSVKAWLSRGRPTYRAPYGAIRESHARQWIVVGSTNAATFLIDDTGSRRYLPVQVGEIDVEGLRGVVDQLWAEAERAHQAGEQWWLDAATEIERAEAAEAHQEEDPWEARVLGWVAGRAPCSTLDVLVGALGAIPAQCGRSEQMRIGAILRRAGYVRWRSAAQGRPWIYGRPEARAAIREAPWQVDADEALV